MSGADGLGWAGAASALASRSGGQHNTTHLGHQTNKTSRAEPSRAAPSTQATDIRPVYVPVSVYVWPSWKSTNRYIQCFIWSRVQRRSFYWWPLIVWWFWTAGYQKITPSLNSLLCSIFFYIQLKVTQACVWPIYVLCLYGSDPVLNWASVYIS